MRQGNVKMEDEEGGASTSGKRQRFIDGRDHMADGARRGSLASYEA